MITSEPILEVNGLSKQFGKFTAVDTIDFDIQDGEFFTIVGPSGSGKTTLLRMLVGMEKPTSGDLLLRGNRINDIPPAKRPTCMVFQSLALFPHMSVGKNVEFPMSLQGIRDSERRTRAFDLLRMLHLDPDKYFNKNINQCSGGERQRVALARALAYDPDILFFDEPLSALDALLRKILQKELKDIQRRTGKTFCYVTHSLEEAMVMSDRVAILKCGVIEQIGKPDEIYSSPRNAFVAEFMGEVNLLDLTIGPAGTPAWNTGQDFIPVELPISDLKVTNEQPRKLLVRPESIRFLGEGETATNSAPVQILNEFMIGSRVQYHVEVNPHCQLTVERMREEKPGEGQVRIAWETADSQILES